MSKKYFFSKNAQTDKFHKVKIMDLVVLMGNLWKGAKDAQIGFEDADQTLNELSSKLDHEVWIKLTDLESALWSCNTLNEAEKFWHPRNEKFDSFLSKLLNRRKFNKIYNLIELDTNDKASKQ